MHTELQMTLHLIIFTSKGQCPEIKHSLMQNHPLRLKWPLEFASEKRTRHLFFHLRHTGEVGKTAAGYLSSTWSREQATL